MIGLSLFFGVVANFQFQKLTTSKYARLTVILFFLFMCFYYLGVGQVLWSRDLMFGEFTTAPLIIGTMIFYLFLSLVDNSFLNAKYIVMALPLVSLSVNSFVIWSLIFLYFTIRYQGIKFLYMVALSAMGINMVSWLYPQIKLYNLYNFLPLMFCYGYILIYHKLQNLNKAEFFFVGLMVSALLIKENFAINYLGLNIALICVFCFYLLTNHENSFNRLSIGLAVLVIYSGLNNIEVRELLPFLAIGMVLLTKLDNYKTTDRGRARVKVIDSLYFSSIIFLCSSFVITHCKEPLDALIASMFFIVLIKDVFKIETVDEAAGIKKVMIITTSFLGAGAIIL